MRSHNGTATIGGAPLPLLLFKASMRLLEEGLTTVIGLDMIVGTGYFHPISLATRTRLVFLN